MSRFYAQFDGDPEGSLYDETGEYPVGWRVMVAWLRENGHLLNPRVRFGVKFQAT